METIAENRTFHIKSGRSFSLRKRMLSIKHGWNGLRIIFRYEHNFRIHCIFTVLVILAGMIAGITETEWLAIVIVTGMVFMSEVFNSALEYLSDFVSPGYSELIKKVKDVSAAAVLVSAVISIITGVMIFYPKIFNP